ncbi:MAG: hypothetical protein NTZ80_03010 [Patescibacteria group bacterium]|nr:hypothetical protein [Patescibacteria group bacterium]
MPRKKANRTFLNCFCSKCNAKIGVSEYNKKNHTLADLAEKVKTKFCRFCRAIQMVKLKDLKQ